MGRPTVVIELAEDPRVARDLAAGGIFVARCELGFNDECDLVVRSAAGERSFPARCVYVDPDRGAGLELVGFGPEMKEQLAALVITAPPDAPVFYDEHGEPIVATAAPPVEEELLELAPEGSEDNDPGADPALDDPGGDADTDASGAPLTATQKVARNMHERLRGLTVVEQLKIAHAGDPSERMVLERMYGKTVWEALLRNPRLTAPEVARLARLGSLPRTLIELIVNNGAWLQIPEVRRALLGNPRLGVDQILRILRMLPKHELKLASTTTAYPFAVRDAAKRLIKGGS